MAYSFFRAPKASCSHGGEGRIKLQDRDGGRILDRAVGFNAADDDSRLTANDAGRSDLTGFSQRLLSTQIQEQVDQP